MSVDLSEFEAASSDSRKQRKCKVTRAVEQMSEEQSAKFHAALDARHDPDRDITMDGICNWLKMNGFEQFGISTHAIQHYEKKRRD